MGYLWGWGWGFDVILSAQSHASVDSVSGDEATLYTPIHSFTGVLLPEALPLKL